MRKVLVAFALISLPFPVLAARPVIFQATSADKAPGFRSMGECEAALGPPARHRGKADVDRGAVRGTLFNRTAGNLSRCEMIAGEPVIVVYPSGREVRSAD